MSDKPGNNPGNGEGSVLKQILALIIDAPWTQILTVAVVLGSMGFLGNFLLSQEKQLDITKLDDARGFITVLFGVGTIAIAVIVTLSGVFLTGEEAKERFARGKEVLGLVLGIFGTIVGFYYGSTTKATTEKPSVEKAAPSSANSVKEPAGSIQPEKN
mgnify:CR=1 FL=1